MRFMNRLWVRLTLAFVGVTLITVTLVALLAGTRAGGEFQQYVTRRDALAESGWMDDLSAYYQKVGSWEGLAAYIENATQTSGNSRRGRGAGIGMGMGMGRPSLLIADVTGRIVYDERDPASTRMLTDDERANALPIQVNEQTVGFFAISSGRMMPAEENFLARLSESLIIAALIAGIVGAGLGVLISRTLVAPLGRLTESAQAFAARRWDQRAETRGATEIAEVGTAFNAMADELSRAEALRRNLMADIAHELRTPLSVMQGNLSAMLDGVYAIERGEIASLYDETRLLARLVNDLRELALADAGQLPLRMEEVETGALLRATCEKFQPAADAQSVTFSLEVPADLPPIKADPDRLSQVLHNLIANALRHSPGGTVTLTGAQHEGQVMIGVTDTGDGIPAEELPHVFDRFYRGDRSRSRTTGGSGLGLAIAKAWVTAMKGQIGVESPPDTGTRFWLTLPAAQSKKPR